MRFCGEEDPRAVATERQSGAQRPTPAPPRHTRTTLLRFPSFTGRTHPKRHRTPLPGARPWDRPRALRFKRPDPWRGQEPRPVRRVRTGDRRLRRRRPRRPRSSRTGHSRRHARSLPALAHRDVAHAAPGARDARRPGRSSSRAWASTRALRPAGIERPGAAAESGAARAQRGVCLARYPEPTDRGICRTCSASRRGTRSRSRIEVVVLKPWPPSSPGPHHAGCLPGQERQGEARHRDRGRGDPPACTRRSNSRDSGGRHQPA